MKITIILALLLSSILAAKGPNLGDEAPAFTLWDFDSTKFYKSRDYRGYVIVMNWFSPY